MGRNVSSFEISCDLMGETLTAHVLMFEEGLHVSVYGGCRTHIGAVSIVDPSGDQQDFEFPGHKDGVIAKKWASALRHFVCPVIVEAGIHYDQLDRKGIQAVLDASDAMLQEVMERVERF